MSRAAIVAAGVALLLVVAWAASRADVDGADRPDTVASPVGAGLRNDVALVVLGGIAMLVALAVIPLVFGRRERLPRAQVGDGRRVRWRLVALTIGLGFAGIYGLLLLAGDDRAEPEPPAAEPVEEPETVEPGEQPGAQGWAAVALLASGAVIVGAGVFVVRRRGLARRRSPGSLDDLLARIDAGIDLDSLPPHDAVRAAYADALRLLDPIGLGPRGPETPHEHLARVRSRLPEVAAPLADLVTHDEVARFSRHPVTSAMKQRSITAHGDMQARVESHRAVLDADSPHADPHDARDGVFADAQRRGASR